MQPDITQLLIPISPDNPAGINLEYEPLFDDIRSAQSSDPDYPPQDEWSVREPRKANWERVRSLCEQALSQQSKDLQLACWRVEALSYRPELTELIQGVTFLSEFITRFWFQCWPSLEEDGLSARRSKLQRLDRRLSQRLCSRPLLHQANTSLINWRQILAFEHKINANPEIRDELLAQEGDLTMETFEGQAKHFCSMKIGLQADRVRQLSHALIELEARYSSVSQDPEGELFPLTHQTLIDLMNYLERLSQSAIPQADEHITLEPQLEISDSEPAAEIIPTPWGSSAPLAMSRERAIEQMLTIADYFRQTEPSSPVPFLMERAARWADMTLTEWLEEMLNDSNSMQEINNVLTGQHR